MPWTQFWDMHSGGTAKEKWSQIFIEAEKEEAEVIFVKRFGHSPGAVACDCCGSNYSVMQYDTLKEATAHHRNCDYVKPAGSRSEGHYIEKGEEIPSGWEVREGYGPYQTVEEYEARDDVLVIRVRQIKPEWRKS